MSDTENLVASFDNLRKRGYEYSEELLQNASGDLFVQTLKLDDGLSIKFETDEWSKNMSFTKILPGGLLVDYKSYKTYFYLNGSLLFDANDCTKSNFYWLPEDTEGEEFKAFDIKIDEYGYKYSETHRDSHLFEIDFWKYIDDQNLFDYFSPNPFIKRFDSTHRIQFIDLPVEII
jgi:hypothetical protein